MIEILRSYFAFAAENFGPLALLGGSLSGYVLTVMLERYFLPIALRPDEIRRQKGLTFLFCWVASSTASAGLWWALDPVYRFGPRLVICYVLGVLTFPAYPIIARYLSDRFPRIASAWMRPEWPG